MRTRLANRRHCVTDRVLFVTGTGHEIRLTVTFGFDEAGQLREAFCADFKSGSDLHATIMDACVLYSRLLQHGDSPDELAQTLCNPPSVIGAIARAGALMTRKSKIESPPVEMSGQGADS
jgi:hypothetical protein